MCQEATALLVSLRLVRSAARRSHLEFDGEALARLQAAGFQDELAVLDVASGEIRSGSDGLLWILADSWAGPLARLCARTPLRQILRVPYRFVAFNRRFLSLPNPRGVRCACEPREHRGYNVAFILLAYGLTGAGYYVISDARSLLFFAVWLLGLFLVVMTTGEATRRLPFLAHFGASTAGFFAPFALLWLATSPSSEHGREKAFYVLALLLGLRSLLLLRRRMRYLGFIA